MKPMAGVTTPAGQPHRNQVDHLELSVRLNTLNLVYQHVAHGPFSA